MSDRSEQIGIPAGLAADIQDTAFDAHRPAVIEAAQFLDPSDRRRILVLAGPPGTGKSAGAAYAVLNARTADQVIAYIDHRDNTTGEAMLPGAPLGARWTHARSFWNGVYKAALWEAAERVPVLVIDDLGAEPADDRVTPLIASLLCERVDGRRKTIATTNMDPALLQRRYGGRVADRLDGWFGTRGPSLRGRAAR